MDRTGRIVSGTEQVEPAPRAARAERADATASAGVRAPFPEGDRSLDQMVRDLQPQIGGALEKLERHTESLRALERRHAQRVSTLNDVLDNLAKLREPEPTVESNLPGPM